MRCSCGINVPAPQPRIEVVPLIAYGRLGAHATDLRTLQIDNRGDAPLTVNALALVGQDADQFATRESPIRLARREFRARGGRVS